jgi:two-component system, response regulator YesN
MPMAETILIVDDDAELREELKCSLDEYDVKEAEDGQKALQVLSRPNDIDLVILDVKMPGMPGTEILKLIKKREPHISVIIFTAFSSKDTAIEALRGEADEYLEKPIVIDFLKKVIERILENKQGTSDLNAIGVNGKIEKIKRFLERNCFKKVSLNECSAIVSMSPKYLSKVFSEITGISFVNYKLKIKIQKAKEFLDDTEMTVSQISDKLAFQNPESFMRIFKKITGRTPSEYRNKLKPASSKNRSKKTAAKKAKKKRSGKR